MKNWSFRSRVGGIPEGHKKRERSIFLKQRLDEDQSEGLCSARWPHGSQVYLTLCSIQSFHVVPHLVKVPGHPPTQEKKGNPRGKRLEPVTSKAEWPNIPSHFKGEDGPHIISLCPRCSGRKCPPHVREVVPKKSSPQNSAGFWEGGDGEWAACDNYKPSSPS